MTLSDLEMRDATGPYRLTHRSQYPHRLTSSDVWWWWWMVVELDMDPFCKIQSNPTQQLNDPIQSNQ